MPTAKPARCVQGPTVAGGRPGKSPRAGSITPEDDEGGVVAGRKRSAPRNTSAPKARAKRPKGEGEDVSAEDKLGRDEDIDWRHVVTLLQNSDFKPGQRPDQIMDEHIVPGLMFKEHPKRRREHSTLTRPMDKWYNTGGIKSASDRFLPGSEAGLRKRYGKVVREGLGVLRFHEYKLLQRLQNGEVLEGKLGPALYRLVPESKRRQESHAQSVDNRPKAISNPVDVAAQRKQLQTQGIEMERLRKETAKLERQLAAAQKKIAKQAAQLSHFSAAAALLGPGSILDGAGDFGSDEDDQGLEPGISGTSSQAEVGAHQTSLLTGGNYVVES